MPGYEWLAKLVTVAILAGFSSVILVMLMGQSRVFFSMSRDGLVPKVFSDVHPQLPHALQVEPDLLRVRRRVRRLRARRHRRRHDQHRHAVRVHAGVRRASGSCACASPKLPRQFRTPLVPLVPILGIIVCAAMIFGLGWTNWLRLGVWLAIGLVIYFAYGRKHSKLRGRYLG